MRRPQSKSKPIIKITPELLDAIFMAKWERGKTFTCFSGLGLGSQYLALCWQSEPSKEKREEFWQKFVANDCQISFIPSKRTKSGLSLNGSKLSGECILKADVGCPSSYSIPFDQPDYEPDPTIRFELEYPIESGHNCHIHFDAKEFVLV